MLLPAIILQLQVLFLSRHLLQIILPSNIIGDSSTPTASYLAANAYEIEFSRCFDALDGAIALVL
jgi:hypothetical protein